MKKADIGVGSGLIIFSAWIFWYAGEYSKAAIYYYGPNFFPQILAIAMMVCAIFLILNALRGKSLETSDRIHLKGFVRMVIAIFICIGYLYLMQIVGFAMGTCVFLYVLMMFIGQKGLVKRIASSIAVALIVWAIFRYFLVIPLPTGIFAFTF
jgi:putative tricarboxylic transport membrane protein